MAEVEFPLRDEKEVQSIVDEILSLSSQAVSLREAVDRRDREAPSWFAQWAASFEIVDEVTSFFNGFKQVNVSSISHYISLRIF
jgi:hypothetical protein